MNDLNLAVALGTSADPNRGDLDAAADLAGKLGRDALQHDREGAVRLERGGVGQELAGHLGGASLDLVAAEAGGPTGGSGRGGRSPGMPGGDDPLDGRHDRGAALQFDRLSATLLHQAAGVLNGLLG